MSACKLSRNSGVFGQTLQPGDDLFYFSGAQIVRQGMNPTVGLCGTLPVTEWRESRSTPPETPPARPVLADDPPRFLLLEREVEIEFRPQMLTALQRQVNA